MDCSEIIGVYQANLYINKDVTIRRPDISKENEVDIIAHSQGSFKIERQDNPRWKREINNSRNYKEVFQDTLIFELFGLNDNNEEVLSGIRNNRVGFIVELVLKEGRSIVFETPMFISIPTEKPENTRNYRIELQYKQPTFSNYLKKLNTIFFAYNLISLGGENILSANSNTIITA
jgi:hypothetical protein